MGPFAAVLQCLQPDPPLLKQQNKNKLYGTKNNCMPTETVAHAQYIASSKEGTEVGALDGLFDYLINERYSDKKSIDYCTPGASVHGIFQARIREQVAISYSRGSS